jgi:thioredoxin 1
MSDEKFDLNLKTFQKSKKSSFLKNKIFKVDLNTYFSLKNMVFPESKSSLVGLIDSEESFHQLVSNGSGFALVDYFAEWCGPCKRFAPTLDRLSTEWTNVKFYKVDVENLQDVAEDENISSMPTFVLYQNGQEVGRLSGASEDRLLALLLKTNNA